ncbi:MAG TPA: DUF1702 family protein [Pyrinomonadaceae bacterium]|nr:DUF1702 family protein [Pyrinomonadaceae bacterium]
MDSLIPTAIRRLFFSIPVEETRFAKRGFRATKPAVVNHLEKIGASFLDGYHSALCAVDFADLENNLEKIEANYRGFSYEGAAMSLALLDRLSLLKKTRIEDFLNGEAEKHIYMVYVGIGWALARLPWTRRRIVQSISNLDSLLKWLAIDGFGFHEGYFNPRRYFHSEISLNSLPEYAKRAFTQGLGRSLWFVEGASVEHISEMILKMPKEMRADLWSGIGLACGYAGGVEIVELEKLKERSQEYLPFAAQGVAFAAKTRLRAENAAIHTENACRIICGLSIEDAAFLTDTTLKKLPETDDLKLPKYEIWRQRIQQEFSREVIYI